MKLALGAPMRSGGYWDPAEFAVTLALGCHVSGPWPVD